MLDRDFTDEVKFFAENLKFLDTIEVEIIIEFVPDNTPRCFVIRELCHQVQIISQSPYYVRNPSQLSLDKESAHDLIDCESDRISTYLLNLGAAPKS